MTHLFDLLMRRRQSCAQPNWPAWCASGSGLYVSISASVVSGNSFAESASLAHAQ